MLHKMNLWDEPFQAIKDGWKTIEMRLNDEKRSRIKIADEIEFKNIKTNEVIYCKVLKLYKYKNFSELYDNHDKKAIGYQDNEEATPLDMLKLCPILQQLMKEQEEYLKVLKRD